MFELPCVPPLIRIAVLEPEDLRRDIRWHMLSVRCVDRLFCSGRHEDLYSLVGIADGALIKRTFDAVVSLGLTDFKGISKVFTLTLPLFNCGQAYIEQFRQFLI